MNVLLSGNEAIARGAYEAGVRVASAYPGTPSTEILESLATFEGVDASWAPNEKVALEVAIGASFGGSRSIACMKHVGLNVAADPLMTLSYTGVGAGLVIVVADDPEMHSSQNEQDSRHYARFSKIPMLEPADSSQCREFVIRAFELSEEYDTPVLIRSCTRVSHGKSIVSVGERRSDLPAGKLTRNPAKLVMLPSNARVRHPIVEERITRLSQRDATAGFDTLEMRSTSVGVICSGVASTYVREVLPDASLLVPGMVHPLPLRLIRDFASKVERLFVIEELDPIIEEQVRALGIPVTGKEVVPLCGELSPGRVRDAFASAGVLPHAENSPHPPEQLPPRPPNMCPGCPHRGLFHLLNRAQAYVTGDIGCYTLGFMPPLNAMDTCICMGASISVASGVIRALNPDDRRKVVAVIGDSTFLHTGINSLMEMAYNRIPGTVVILDNRITAMTGRQENPASGYTLSGEPAPEVDIPALCRSFGIRHVEVVDPYDLKRTGEVLRREMERDETSVIITNRPCCLIKGNDRFTKEKPFRISDSSCTGCRACLRIGCPAISWVSAEGGKGRAVIDPSLCTGCSLCAQLCRFDAITREGDR